MFTAREKRGKETGVRLEEKKSRSEDDKRATKRREGHGRDGLRVHRRQVG